MSYNVENSDTVLLIHGAGSIGEEWKNFKDELTKLGYTVIAPTLRNHKLGHSHPEIGNLSLYDYINDLEALIGSLKVKPIIIGHSMGGLLALILCSKNLAKLGILITPAAPKGINAISVSVLRIFILNIFRWQFWKRPVPPNYNSARYGVLHDLAENRAIQVFEQSHSAESGRALCEIGFPYFYKNCASEIAFTEYTCKTLVIGCGRDRITPISIARKLYRALGKSADYQEFATFSHYIMEGEEFMKVFKVCSKWIKMNTPKTP